MAWLALDRAIRIAAARGDRRRRRQQRWAGARDALADDIRTRGFDPAQDAYTGAYGSAELDAAVLLPVLEFEPATSPRVVGTVDAIRRRLGAGGPLAVPLPARHRRPHRRRRRLPALLVLARPSAGPHRPPRRSRSPVRRTAHPRWPARPVRRGDGPRHRRASRQLSRRPSPTPPSSKRCSPSATPRPRSASGRGRVRQASGRDRARRRSYRQCRRELAAA